MKVFENEYETVLANTPEEAKKVIQDCIDDHLDFEEIDDFKLAAIHPMIVYETMESIPACIRNLESIVIDMVEFSYYGSDKYFGVTISLSDWEEIAEEYIKETGGAFICSTEY